MLTVFQKTFFKHKYKNTSFSFLNCHTQVSSCRKLEFSEFSLWCSLGKPREWFLVLFLPQKEATVRVVISSCGFCAISVFLLFFRLIFLLDLNTTTPSSNLFKTYMYIQEGNFLFTYIRINLLSCMETVLWWQIQVSPIISKLNWKRWNYGNSFWEVVYTRCPGAVFPTKLSFDLQPHAEVLFL